MCGKQLKITSSKVKISPSQKLREVQWRKVIGKAFRENKQNLPMIASKTCTLTNGHLKAQF